MSNIELNSLLGAFEGSIEFIWGPSRDEPNLIANKIDQLNEGLRDFTDVLLASREIILDEVKQRFDNESDPTGKKWQERSPVTLKWYYDAKQYYSTILRKDDNLYYAATDRNSYQVEGNDLFVDTSGWPVYWHIHNVGGTAGKGAKIPERNYLGTSEAPSFAILAVFDEWLQENLQIIVSPKTGIPVYHGAFGRFTPFRVTAQVGLGKGGYMFDPMTKGDLRNTGG